MNSKAVEVNQRALVDKILSRYPGEFTVFRELLQNADDAGARNFVINFETPVHLDAHGSNGTRLDLNSVKVSKWSVKNDGTPFHKNDWSRLTNIAEGNPDVQKIGAFGVGFYSVFSVTDQPIVKSHGKMMSVFYKDGKDQLFVKEDDCKNDGWTTIELKLKQDSPIPRTFELTRFLVTSMTFLEKMECVTISLNNERLSTVTRSRLGGRPVIIPGHMNRKSPEGNVTINSAELIPYKVVVEFAENPLVGALKVPIVSHVRLEESERKPTDLHSFFHKFEEKFMAREVAAQRHASATSEAPKLKAGAQFSTECLIYSANVSVSVKGDLNQGLEHAIKKKPPKEFSFQLVFFTKEEHDKQTREDSNSTFGNVFCGPQGLCPPLQGDAGRIFIGQSTTQTTGIACHMSGRFIPTVERGSIDLANGYVAKWNKELLYIGGFLARIAYDSEMNSLRDEWSDAAQDFALHTIKCFTPRQSTPDPTVSNIIERAFFDCSTDDFPIISNIGIRNTKEIRREYSDFTPFMKTTPVLTAAIRLEILPMIKALPEKLRVRSYTFQDVVDELKSRTLDESEMAACLSWWINTIQSKGAYKEIPQKFGIELLNAGKAISWGKEIKLSAIQTFIDSRMSRAFDPEDPLPEDTIPPPLIEGIDPSKIQHAFGWKKMPIAHWLHYLRDVQQNEMHDIRQNPVFASHILTVLSDLWYVLPYDSLPDIKEALENVTCIPMAPSDEVGMRTPEEAYFPEADIFHDLPVINQELLEVSSMVHVLELLGVRKRCDINTFIKKATNGEKWDVMDLVTYLASSAEYAGHVTGLNIFPCSDSARPRRCLYELFVPTDMNRQLGLPVVICGWMPGSEGARLLVRFGCREHPTMEELIHIASHSDPPARRLAFALLCDSRYETEFETHSNSSKFSSYAFIPGVKNGKHCHLSRDEVFSDRSWALFGLGQLPEQLDKRIVQRLKIRERPTATKLIEVLESNPPKDMETATKWFRFLAEKGVFSAGDFTKIAKLKIVPVPESEQQEPKMVSPCECFLKSIPDEENMENSFYQRLFKFVDFGPEANAFLQACGVKHRPECIDILQKLLASPKEFYQLAKHERYTAELRMIAVGYKSLPKSLLEEMQNAEIFLGCRPQKGLEGQDEYKLCKVQDVLIADDMESRRRFGDFIYIAPQEELLANFYSEMGVKSLSSCIKYTVKPSKDIPWDLSPNAQRLHKCIIEKMPIFLHEFDEQRFRPGMYLLPWHDQSRFSVRGCAKLSVTKELEFKTGEGYDPELTAEILVKSPKHELWVKEKDFSNYDVAVAMCRILFSTYKTSDVLSLVTILDTPVDVLEKRGYDVQRIQKDYEKKHSANGYNDNAPEALPEPSPPKTRSHTKFKNLLHRGRKPRKDPKLGEVNDIDASFDKVKEVMKEQGGKDSGHISNREKIAGGKKQKNVGYCNEKNVAQNNLEEYKIDGQTGQIKIWKQRGTELAFPTEACNSFVKIISDIAKIFDVNQTRCHIFYHTSDTGLMGFNRNDEIYFGLEHYIEKHHGKDKALGKAYTDWYFIMAHELAHVHTPYHDEHHEILTAEMAARHLTRFHDLDTMKQEFKCTPL